MLTFRTYLMRVMCSRVCLLITFLFFCSAPTAAQDSPNETRIVKGDANSCELNSAYLDYMAAEQSKNGGLIFVIARLGNGEVKRSISLDRLQYARFYLLMNREIQRDKVVFAEGERVDGEGRVEFYLGSKLHLVSLAERGKNVCLTYCDDYVPPKKNRRKRRV